MVGTKGNIECSVIPYGQDNDPVYRDDGTDFIVTGLRGFLDSAAIVIEGRIITRRVLIDYVANKAGGVHYDPKRNTSKKKEQLYSLLDRITWNVEIDEPYGLIASKFGESANKNAIYYELLSAGQAICNSPDMQNFMHNTSMVIS